MVQLIGKGRALELLMSATLIDAATALQYGLVNYVVPTEALIAKATGILNIINSKAPLAVAACIQSANAVYNETQNGYDVEVDEFGNCFGTNDMIEGTTAFLEKEKQVSPDNKSIYKYGIQNRKRYHGRSTGARSCLLGCTNTTQY